MDFAPLSSASASPPINCAAFHATRHVLYVGAGKQITQYDMLTGESLGPASPHRCRAVDTSARERAPAAPPPRARARSPVAHATRRPRLPSSRCRVLTQAMPPGSAKSRTR